MPFCHSPWTNIDISPLGDISPCCKFENKKYDDTFNIQSCTIDDYANSNFLNQVKQEFQNNRWPAGCEQCQFEEKNNIKSKRILDHTRWKEHYQQYDLDSHDFITASIAFGNTCNLKCITCNSKASSLWRQEYQDIYNVDVTHFKFYKKDFVKDFTVAAPKIIHFDIPGGEPFLSGIAEQKQLLKHYIDSGQAEKITLHYTTNVSIFPSDEWWDLWKHFYEVDIQLSIDGIGDHYEYIRFPANWEVLVENTKKYLEKKSLLLNFKLSVSHTISAYNVYYLDKFISWCYTMGLPKPWLGRVHNPKYMRPSIWPEPARSTMVEHLKTSRYPEVKLWADVLSNTDDSDQFEMFQQLLHKHDQYRDLNFDKTFPELANYTCKQPKS